MSKPPRRNCSTSASFAGFASSRTQSATLADLLVASSILLRALGPGFVRTDMTQRGRGAAEWATTPWRMSHDGPDRKPEDIANAVVFLASLESGWITARCLR